jgi:hypothetical protein
LSPDEDAVYMFVNQVARGYAGNSVWKTAARMETA